MTNDKAQMTKRMLNSIVVASLLLLTSCVPGRGVVQYGKGGAITKGIGIADCKPPDKRYASNVKAALTAALGDVKNKPYLELEAALESKITKLKTDYSQEGLDTDLIMFRICEMSINRGFTNEQTNELIKLVITAWKEAKAQRKSHSEIETILEKVTRLEKALLPIPNPEEVKQELSEIRKEMDQVVEEAEAEYEKGNEYYYKYDFKQALEHFQQAVNKVKTRSFYLALAGTQYYLAQYTPALKNYEIALKLARKKQDEKLEATLLNNISQIYQARGKYKQAIGYLEQALSLWKEAYGEKHPKVATGLNNLGSAWGSLGKYKKAIGYYEQALSLWKEAYGERHPQVAAGLNNLGLAWKSLGKYKQAIGYYEQALSLWKEAYGERHPQVATGLNNLGSAWKSLGEYKKAIDYYEQALSIDKQFYGERHPDVARDLNNLGSAWDSLGEYKKAIGYYGQALSIDKEFYGERHPNVAICLNNLGGAWYSLGEYGKAREYFQQAYSIFIEFLGEDHPSTKGTKEWLEALAKK